jgi:hypothetical protein
MAEGGDSHDRDDGGGDDGGERGGSVVHEGDSRHWDVVLGCEILYWGGWSLFDEDTRGPLLATLRAACDSSSRGGSETEVALAFTVRDKGRETRFVLDDIGGAFWLRLLGDGEKGEEEGEEEVDVEEGERIQMDAAARAVMVAAVEGDLLLLGARLRT